MRLIIKVPIIDLWAFQLVNFLRGVVHWWPASDDTLLLGPREKRSCWSSDFSEALAI
jgi:hypothetical protein